MKDYFRRINEVNFPHFCKKFNLSPEKAALHIADLWDGWTIVNNMICTNKTSQKWWYETCPNIYKRGQSCPSDSIQAYWLSHNGEDRHVSVFSHDKKWLESTRNGSVSCVGTKVRAGLLWIEIDRKNYLKESNLQKAIDDGVSIKEKIEDMVLSRRPDIPNDAIAWLFYSGNTSTHLAINASLFGNPITDQKWCGRRKVWYNLAHNLAGDIRFGNGIVDVSKLSDPELKEAFKTQYPNVKIVNKDEANQLFKSNLSEDKLRKVLRSQPNMFLWDGQIASQSLENIDPNIYHTNALIRQPYSKHETGGDYKTLIGEDRPMNIKNLPPVLLDQWWKAWEEPEYKNDLDTRYNSGYIIEQYKDVFPDIEYRRPNEKGWVGRFHNPFYADGNPDATVNIYTGTLKDFGSERYSMTFEEFLMKKKELNL